MTTNKKLSKIVDEIWKDIKGTDGKYQVSNYGRVKSFCNDKTKGKILKPGNIRGFYSVTLRINRLPHSFLVHKLTAESFIPKDSSNQNVVIHLDWNKQNNHVSNLQWVSKNESYKRMFKKFLDDNKKSNRIIRRNAKLKEEDVKLLKSMLKRGVKQNVIAKLFAISEMQVTRIKKKVNWSEIN
jgi:NUMOD4 motif/HNH endonuclease